LKIPNKMCFVFGSNEGGFHGAGAAAFALRRKGAILRQAFGFQGESFAIPTKDATIRHTLSLPTIKAYVDEFIEEAKMHPELSFQVTRIGCGLAGLKDENIAPMFKDAPDNCWFDTAWQPWLGERNYWGHF
jgi:hypothetical protein